MILEKGAKLSLVSKGWRKPREVYITQVSTPLDLIHPEFLVREHPKSEDLKAHLTSQGDFVIVLPDGLSFQRYDVKSVQPPPFK